MSVSKWDWKPICDTRPCPGDCDLCGYDDDTYTITAENGTVSVGESDERTDNDV